MKAVDLAVKTREIVGRSSARMTRRAGEVPAILYGIDMKPLALLVSAREFINAVRRAETVHMMVNLKLDGNGRTEMALVREVQTDPVTGRPVHIDFLHVSPERKIKMTVSVHLKGVPEGVRTHGGILQHVMRELAIETLPINIPEFIELDVAALGIGDAVHVRDIVMEGVTILSDSGQTIASVVPPTVIKETVPTVPTEAEAAGAPEVITEKKKEGEDESAEEGAKAKKEDKKEEKKEKKEKKEK